MKKLLVVLMAIALMISLSAFSCDGESEDSGDLRSRFFEWLFGRGKDDISDDSYYDYDDELANVELIEDMLAARNSATAADFIWTVVSDVDFGTQEIHSLIFVGDKFFVRGEDGELAYSADGINWTMVPAGSGNNAAAIFGYSGINAIAWNGTTYVAVGNGDSNGGIIAYSSDGLRWTAIPPGTRAGTTTFGTNGIYGITCGGGKFIAFGRGARMAQSADGINWTALPQQNAIFGSEDIRSIFYVNNKFIAFDYYSKTAQSADGANWTEIPEDKADSLFNAFDNDPINTITYGDGMLVAGGRFGKLAYSSDGISWTAIPPGTGPGTSTFRETSDFNDITWGAGKFIAVGLPLMGRGSIWAQSPDGINWTEINRGTIIGTPHQDLGSYINSIAYGADRFVGCGYFNPEYFEITYYIAYSDEQ